MTDDAKTKKTDDPKYWPRVAELTMEASLHGRRIHRPDIEQAAKLAAQTFQTALETQGYTTDLHADVTYSYRALRKRVAEHRTPTLEENIAEVEAMLEGVRAGEPTCTCGASEHGALAKHLVPCPMATTSDG